MAGHRQVARGNRAEVQPLVDEVVRVVCNHVRGKHVRLYLFGSWAQGRALPVSDLDIALDTGTPLDPATIQQITESLDELPTLRKVDLVDLQAVDHEFRERVMGEGELIHVG